MLFEIQGLQKEFLCLCWWKNLDFVDIKFVIVREREKKTGGKL